MKSSDGEYKPKALSDTEELTEEDLDTVVPSDSCLKPRPIPDDDQPRDGNVM